MVRGHCLYWVLALLVASGWCADLPATFKRCRVSPELDNKPNQCMISAAQDAIGQLSKGIPELGVAPLDPFDIGTLSVNEGNGPLSFNLTIIKGKLYGNSRAKIQTITGKLSSPKGFRLFIKYNIDELILKGKYSINGRILLLPITGAGNGKMAFKNVVANMTIDCKPVVKNGKEYLKVVRNVLDYDMDRTIYNIDNLFNGNKMLSDLMNQFMNDNWRELFNFATSFKQVFRDGTGEYVNKIIESVEFNKLFITE